jgi:hypothetical protein
MRTSLPRKAKSKTPREEGENLLSQVGHLVSRIIGTDDDEPAITPKRSQAPSTHVIRLGCNMAVACEDPPVWTLVVTMVLLVLLSWMGLYFLPVLMPYILQIVLPLWYVMLDVTALPLILPWNMLVGALGMNASWTVMLPSMSLRTAFSLACASSAVPLAQ